jgi:quinol-cytochrome oxidoreductase complex cytochrome b subunit
VRVPPSYRRLRWLSALALLLLFLQVLTGVLLSLYYYPEPDAAYDSIRFLSGEVAGGWLVRSLHHWSGELLLLAVLGHLALVYFRRAYARPREYEWVLGGLLLLSILAFRFTGGLLPWDQVGQAATRAGLDALERVPILGGLMARWLRAGEDLGPNTLSRFFATHVLVLPWVTALLAGVHLWLVKRHGLAGAGGGTRA